MRQLFTFLHNHVLLIVICSVRANLRNGVPGFKITSNYLLRCLYSKEDIDPDSPEDGLLRGPLLLRVCFYRRIHMVYIKLDLLQIYRYIFTSPSSASDENLTSEPTARRRDVATTLRLDGQVTGRSIAYAATQVCSVLRIYVAQLIFYSLFSH